MNTGSKDRGKAWSRREFLMAGGATLAGLYMSPRVMAQATDAPRMPVGLAHEPLPYAFDALEPVIDALTMEIHHGRHHAGYVGNLNAALQQEPSLQGRPLEDLLASLPSVPDSVRTAVRNHGGGHYNHALFWKWMTPDGGGEPEGALREAMDRDLGGFQSFKTAFETAAGNRFGSGWAWLIVNREGKLAVGSTANQDNPLMRGISPLVGTPVLGLDVWEHAYYLQYQNRRAAYVQAWWDVVNWRFAGECYEAAVPGAAG